MPKIDSSAESSLPPRRGGTFASDTYEPESVYWRVLGHSLVKRVRALLLSLPSVAATKGEKLYRGEAVGDCGKSDVNRYRVDLSSLIQKQPLGYLCVQNPEAEAAVGAVVCPYSNVGAAVSAYGTRLSSFATVSLAVRPL